MGPDGFISCFDHLMDPSKLRRMIILKGGPGVGKSTFMRRMHAAFCAEGMSAALYFCSGDPDSLDAVAIEDRGLLILDGTAPHIVDPIIPGARDSIVNFGICLDEVAMTPRLPQIKACMADHAAASRRARAYMKAAWALRQDVSLLISSCMDDYRTARLVQALIDTALSGKSESDAMPRVRPIITDAVTPKGELCLLTQTPSQRVIRLVCLDGMDLTPALQAVSRAALAAGYGVEEHLCPFAPGRLMHLSIPALQLLITTHEMPSEQTFDFASCVPPVSLLRHDCALEQMRCEIARCMQAAVAALQQGKQLHDELETFYVPHMDFTRWQTLYDQTLASLR